MHVSFFQRPVRRYSDGPQVITQTLLSITSTVEVMVHIGNFFCQMPKNSIFEHVNL